MDTEMNFDRHRYKPRTMKENIIHHLKANLIIIMMVIALAIGVVVGLTVRNIEGWEYWQKRKIFYLRFPGDLLMNMLKMLILPLIVSSIISSLASLNAKASGRMGLRAVVYYLTTTFAAVIMGIILVLVIQPGKRGGAISRSGDPKEQEPLEALFDLIRNCFPDNLVESTFRRQTTETGTFEYQLPITLNDTNQTEVMGNFTSEAPSVVKNEGMNILGIVVFSVFLGAVIASMAEAGKPLLDFFEALHVATMKLTMLVIWYSPVGIIFLVSTKLIEMEDPSTVFIQLGYYMLTVLAGLAAHGLIVLPVVYLIATRKNPLIFMYNMLKALLTAWGTASSSATLPVTMECLEHRNHIDIRVAKFVAPIGATINMDGTALYEAVAAIFIAQVNGVGLSIGEVITVSLTATAAAIGAAGIPSAGLVTMTIVLTAVGLPTEDVSLILAIDWFLDRFRTAINVLGDSFGAGIVDHLSQADLVEIDRQNDLNMTLEHVTQTKAEEAGVTNTAFVNGEMKITDNGDIGSRL
ncbi:excitatory amino acid transporter 1-like [Mercenaria mercenaria]|uniref:excitatory amino acid transporter 1-like n=1 Tax=Mercenaria mercenaria TaxID=6596 RepID=UPI001E1D58CE|nr:excitatory amino acid transporter 1-like [Mercenaria mercenaria]XP_045158776.1 excitatory amino acid transporter 1-like [Mercenaria mercenaria]XP_045158777.1 excitatory amino acid transporter 1-like [Mercenaria mercenaria]XP_053394696.1 excitatory amino acid transporter 1-like [Mercenaria mercenaria]